MKKYIPFLTAALVFSVALPLPLHSRDMRALPTQAREAREILKQKAEAEKAAAEKAAAESRTRILQDRKAMRDAMDALEKSNRELQAEIEKHETALAKLTKTESELSEKLNKTDTMIRELVGAVRISAKDTEALIKQNPRTALGSFKTDFLAAIARESKFPGMADVRGMADALRDQITATGEVSLQKGTLMDRAGQAVPADILMLGPFTVAYRIGKEAGFSNYAAGSGSLYALSRLPSSRMQQQIIDYMEGRSETVPIDITRGGALRQLTHTLSLWEQIPKGGPIVWPILLILAAGLLIIIERVLFLIRKRLDAESLMRRIETLSSERNWDECRKECDLYPGKPVARVLEAGLSCCHMEREELENALQEAILKEIPPMERFLSTLGMLAAIAPLLGLLGTVTGMIDTFHVITLYGTGDPRLMSGGISEALITTMLGLSVAIPLMLAQTLLNRAADKRIGEMEEKAVSLVNTVHKHREDA